MSELVSMSELDLVRDDAMNELMHILVGQGSHDTLWQEISKNSYTAKDSTGLGIDVQYIAQVELLFNCIRVWTQDDWRKKFPRIRRWANTYKNTIAEKQRREVSDYLMRRSDQRK